MGPRQRVDSARHGGGFVAPPASSDMSISVHVDGRTLEGGGQLVRNALALSALTSIPVTIDHVRGNRKGRTGLKGSHTAAVRFLAEVCGGEVIGANIGSSQLTFFPRGRRRSSPERTAPPTALQALTLSEPYIKPEYNIRQSTAGSIFLIFQALYPYLLYAGARTYAHWPIRLNVTGGTNVSFSPSYDYVAQVLVPNFAKLGLPHLSVDLHKRGWGTGPVDLGSVTFVIYPLGCNPTRYSTGGEKIESTERSHEDAASAESSLQCTISTDLRCATSTQSVPKFPIFSLKDCKRGKITRVDVTILAPDIPLKSKANFSHGYQRERRRNARNNTVSEKSYDSSTVDIEADSTENREYENGFGKPDTVRSFLQAETCEALSRALKSISISSFRESADPSVPPPLSLFPDTESKIPIKIHTSEGTGHHSRLYVLLVAHTSKGFKLGRDALFGGHRGGREDTTENRKSGKGRERGKGHSSHASAAEDDIQSRIRNLVDRCVTEFIDEISEHPHQSSDNAESAANTHSGGKARRKPCVDVFMRDQLVVFEALGKLQIAGQEAGEPDGISDEVEEDEQDWSLHTRTAMWVCEKILGKGV